MLDRFQKKHIRNKIKEIGNVKEIKKLYNQDDEVSKYALELLEKGDFKEGKAMVYFKIKEYKEAPIDSPEVFTDYLEATQQARAKAKENPKRIFHVARCTKKGK
jgi:hypothetical protein